MRRVTQKKSSWSKKSVSTNLAAVRGGLLAVCKVLTDPAGGLQSSQSSN
uniref:Uncharacterized protein n=1 Tax=uncultured alpha proteobacterium HF0130_06E21 TaxID=710808 RepID=E0XT18_9PROT|nr:hypothetical protein [uncultured alpha proteobacterium HF0130_06E21]